MLAILKLLRRHYPAGQRIHPIPDNFSPHRTAEVLGCGREHNIRLIWTSTNASWLNPIECQLTQVKEFVVRGSNYADHQGLKIALNHYGNYRNRTVRE